MLLVDNQDTSYKKIAELRRNVKPKNMAAMLENIKPKSKEAAIQKAIEIVQAVTREVEMSIGADLSMRAEAGYGIGHLRRNFVNAVNLITRLEPLDPALALIGLAAGALHDIGDFLTDRQEEDSRIVRHAEIGALAVDKILSKLKYDDQERLLITYGIASHTHILNARSLVYESRVYELKPYPDTYNSEPCMAVWLPRWISRLERSGPCFTARHYLSLFNENNPLVYVEQMQPVIQEEDTKNSLTMITYLFMHLETQTNNSVYGRYDYGIMQFIRNKNRDMLYKIISVAYNSKHQILSYDFKDIILNAWYAFLVKNIEPSANSLSAATVLNIKFNQLDKKTQEIWINVFFEIMINYIEWANYTIWMFEDSIKSYQCQFNKSISKLIKPDEEWFLPVREVGEFKYKKYR